MSDTSSIILGVIGFGAMGGAIARGVADSPALQGRFSLIIYERNATGASAALEEGLLLVQDAADLARKSNVILLAVKPDQVAAVMAGIAPELTSDKVLVSIAAGITLQRLACLSDHRCPVIRVMPNTPAIVGKGLFGFCPGPDVPPDRLQDIRAMFAALGTVLDLPESRMNAFTALAGSGPAYVFHFLDSLAEAGVSAGLDRASSRAIALGLLQGGAAMAELSGKHPVELREQVSSPAGTTLAALNHLDRTGVRGHLIDAVLAATARGREMEEE